MKTVNTPHTITVSKDGLTATKTVTVNANMTVDMTLGGATPSVISAFSDISAGYWAEGYVNALYEKGITKGCGSGVYCPESAVTRVEMAAFITRVKYGEDFPYTPTPYFNDMPASNSFFKYVQKLKDDNITRVSGLFNTGGTVSRAEMAALLIRAKYGDNFTCTQTPHFSDVPPTDGFFKYIQKLKDDGITTSSGSFLANNPVTRAEMAAFLSRAFLGMH
ncbi:MAG: S-layer homology domain-containing protein [Nitrospirales bacterium]|nr:S-layer homology domain-containing protein [Nitrospirales bacterium]